MLSTVAVAGIDDRHWRDLRSSFRSPLLVMTNHDNVRVAADDADGIFNLFVLELRRKSPRMFGRQHLAAKAIHGGFEAEARACRRLVEQGRHDATLVVEGAAPSDNALHGARSIEQFHQQGYGELLRFDDMLEFHGRNSPALDYRCGRIHRV